jgi:hypothetical protein
MFNALRGKKDKASEEQANKGLGLLGGKKTVKAVDVNYDDEDGPVMPTKFPGMEKEAPAQKSFAEIEDERLQKRARIKAKTAAVARAQIVTEVYGEQPFIPGVDPGLKTWIYVREQMRAVEQGTVRLPTTYPTRIKYKYLTYWEPEVQQPYKDLMAEGYEYQRQRADEREKARLEEEERDAMLERRRERVEAGEEDENAYQREEFECEEMNEEDANVHYIYAPETPLGEEEKDEDDGNKSTKNDGGEGEEERGLVLPPLKGDNPPRFPGWSIQRFRNFMQWGDRVEALLVAYHHHHWHYLDMMLDGPRGRSLINIHVTERTERTLLHVCVMHGDEERLEYLLNHGADAKAKDHRGETVLHLCMDHDIYNAFHPLKIAQRLIQAGAKVSEPNKRGVTPLHRAVLLDARSFISLFLRNKADVYLFDSCNKLPLHYTNSENHQEIKKIFNENSRYCGRDKHRRMWAYGMSRDFVKSVFDVTAPKCVVCKRKQYACASLKQRDFRYWIYAHELAKKNNKRG